MTILKKESIPPFTAHFVETTINGAGYSLLSGFPFVFSPARVSVDSVSDNRRQGNLPDELVFKESSVSGHFTTPWSGETNFVLIFKIQ
jgi:hypothetical protein